MKGIELNRINLTTGSCLTHYFNTTSTLLRMLNEVPSAEILQVLGDILAWAYVHPFFRDKEVRIRIQFDLREFTQNAPRSAKISRKQGLSKKGGDRSSRNNAVLNTRIQEVKQPSHNKRPWSILGNSRRPNCMR